MNEGNVSGSHLTSKRWTTSVIDRDRSTETASVLRHMTYYHCLRTVYTNDCRTSILSYAASC